ncbi:type I restriction enzyme specificity HsdS domain protein [Mycoplasma haemocanis str. Illinois]|uniref:Type I restriction enzyme specificity HsdS domain protein n=1 Tax=Mycoplasma haemocanis (strain Illinois) TaxID=1111676 RepID=H6N6Y9_MYCHN|nr:restriction endonuclease subunit S [Mycoplasma haemocanis]AEW45411.1 type I restriction enzyme specificity HsdS domain protein [Mycoplasma haemocanis str. Illinois]
MFRDLLKGEVREYSLGDICEVQNGYSFASGKYRDSGYPIIRIGNVHDVGIQEDDLIYFRDEDYKEDLSRFIVEPKDLIITARGSCGKVALNQTDRRFYLNQGVWRLDPNPEFLDKEYLFHFLLDFNFDSMAVKGIIPRLNVNQFKKLKIPVPSLSTQQAIVSRLNKFREIEREINLRDKQYEYYRNYLISGGTQETSF